jgi:hypothetical protein
MELGTSCVSLGNLGNSLPQCICINPRLDTPWGCTIDHMRIAKKSRWSEKGIPPPPKTLSQVLAPNERKMKQERD